MAITSKSGGSPTGDERNYSAGVQGDADAIGRMVCSHFFLFPFRAENPYYERGVAVRIETW